MKPKTDPQHQHQHDSPSSQQQHEQHFVDGIGDGKLSKHMDIPDPSRRQYIRKRFKDRHKADFGDAHHHRPPPHQPQNQPELQELRDPRIPLGNSQHAQDLDDNIDLTAIKLFTMLGLFVAVSFASNLHASRSRRKSRKQLMKRTDSLLVRQKKKTDEWGEDSDDYGNDFRSDVNMDVPVREPSPIYLDMREGNNLHNRKRVGSENVGPRLRNTSITRTNLQVTRKAEEVLPLQRPYRGGGGAAGNGLDGLDGFDVSTSASSVEKDMSICSDADDEEMPSPSPSPRGSINTSSTFNSLDTGPDGEEGDVDADVNVDADVDVDVDEETPTTSAKPTIYVDSFAQLTMPSIIQSPSRTQVSDGNAKFDSFLDHGGDGSNAAELSGETEGANGILHKRKDLTACSDAASSLFSPIAFSELKLGSLIGGGGFGQVWRATWRGTPVAVKVLSASSQSYNVQKAILQEFAAEINMLSGMRHPNICLYLGACLEPSNRAIVTELAANGSLWDALRTPLNAPYTSTDGLSPMWPIELYGNSNNTDVGRRNILSPPPSSWPWVLVRKVAEGAARGINYLHCGNPAVLHRDLKSANILLDDSYNPKVCDFGLSRLKANEKSMTGNCGTVQWMAPEILANEAYAEPADVYSYGIVLWELLTRECPFEGMSSIQCAMAVLNHSKRPEVPNWCPQVFASLIERCLDKDPKKRPTIAEILSAFDSMPR